MAELRHYLVSSDESEEHKHYLGCENDRVPYISIGNEGNKYAKISYDSITMSGFSYRKRQVYNAKEFDAKYQSICKMLCEVQPEIEAFIKRYHDGKALPKVYRNISGSEGSCSFFVYKDDANSIAESLYQYLMSRIKIVPNHENAFELRMRIA